jgi:hypothetical protein
VQISFVFQFQVSASTVKLFRLEFSTQGKQRAEAAICREIVAPKSLFTNCSTSAPL